MIESSCQLQGRSKCLSKIHSEFIGPWYKVIVIAVHQGLREKSWEVTAMSEERNTLGNNKGPGSQGANAAVASAGEPSEPVETRDLSAEEVGVSPEELDEREQRKTRPRKKMGPTTDYRAETTPEEAPEEGS